MLEKINFCINKTNNNLNSLYEMKEAEIANFNEALLFNVNLSKIIRNLDKIHNQIILNKIILQELRKIKSFKNVSDDVLNDLTSDYGSLYLGTDTFYYNDHINDYSLNEFYQILLNHIGHYLLDFIFHPNDETFQKSNLLLLFDNISSFYPNKNISYAQNGRNVLYDRKDYQDIVKNNIFFPTNKNIRKYVLDNKISNDYLKFKYENELDMLYTKKIFITLGKVYKHEYIYYKQPHHKRYLIYKDKEK